MLISAFVFHKGTEGIRKEHFQVGKKGQEGCSSILNDLLAVNWKERR